MTAAVRALLDSFDALSDAEQHEAAVELLRRAMHPATAGLPDETLVTAAEALFRDLDAGEAATLTQAHLLDLERRLDAYRDNPKAGTPWEEVEARLRGTRP